MDLNLPDNEKFWCPHCGHTQKLKLKEGFPI
jgi:transposase